MSNLPALPPSFGALPAIFGGVPIPDDLAGGIVGYGLIHFAFRRPISLYVFGHELTHGFDDQGRQFAPRIGAQLQQGIVPEHRADDGCRLQGAALALAQRIDACLLGQLGRVDVHAQQQAVRAPVQGQRDRGLACGVQGRGEGHDLGRAEQADQRALTFTSRGWPIFMPSGILRSIKKACFAL